MSLYTRLFSLDGKKALVTGGATGIGYMIASTLAEAGAEVMIASRSGEDCKAAAERINSTCKADRAEGFTGDVGSEDGVSGILEEVQRRTQKLDILVNNAGTTWGQPLSEFSYQAWSKVMDVNVTGLFDLTRRLLPLLKAAASEQHPARIVNLGSVMGSVPIGENAYSYAASKAAVHHLTKILAKELCDRHITVNALAPGPFESRMTAFATRDKARSARIAERVPMGRIGRSEDIASATLFLCGGGGSYVTGAVLPLCGGIHLISGEDLFAEND